MAGIERNNSLSLEQIKLRAEVKRYHAFSGRSAGARSLADLLSTTDYPFSRYRAKNLMVELKLESCQIPQHNFKKANKEHVEIPNSLNRQFDVIEPNRYWCGDVAYIWIDSR